MVLLALRKFPEIGTRLVLKYFQLTLLVRLNHLLPQSNLLDNKMSCYEDIKFFEPFHFCDRSFKNSKRFYGVL